MGGKRVGWRAESLAEQEERVNDPGTEKPGSGLVQSSVLDNEEDAEHADPKATMVLMLLFLMLLAGLWFLVYQILLSRQ